MKPARIFLLAIILILSNYAKSQISVGAQSNYNYHIGSRFGYLGYGLNAEFTIAEFGSIRLGYNVGSKTVEQTFSVIPLSTQISNPLMEVAGTNKLKLNLISIDYKSYLGDGDYYDGGLYIFTGFGVYLINSTLKLENYNEDLYDIGFEVKENTKLTKVMFHGGLGADFEITSKLFGFAEAGFCARRSNMMELNYTPAAEISGAVIGNVGVRFMISG